MANIKRFEDIDAWKKARAMPQAIYKVTSQGEFTRDLSLRDQMRRASVSVMSNIAEGFERDGNKEFRQFLSLAKGSAGEIKGQLYVALDAGFLNEAQFDHLYSLADETSRIIGGFMKYLGQSNLKGSKFHKNF